MGSRTTEAELRELLKEAADAARDDHGTASAIAWAGGYVFPPEYMESDVRCLRAAQLDFKAMVRRRLASLAPDRLNTERVAQLRPDNPELALMHDLVGGMRVHLPEGFAPNGTLPRTSRRPIYETVATAVNKMLGGIVAQKLAFLLPLDLALQHVPSCISARRTGLSKKENHLGNPLGTSVMLMGPLSTRMRQLRRRCGITGKLDTQQLMISL